MARFGWMLALAFTYALAGKAGLLLAIPPGYATAVWPPSGIAAAVLLLGGLWLWPGVLLGSLAVNLWMSGDFSSTPAVLHSLLIAGGIASGAAVQAVLAAALVRMSVPHLNIFRLETGVVRLLLVAGPVACVVNATIGVSTLFIAGLIPAESFLFNWWTWWIGDSIGVLVFLPLILIWNQRPYAEWWNKQVTVSAPTVLIFVAVVCLFFFTSAREESRIRSSFEQLVDGAGHEFSQSLAGTDKAMRSLAAFVEANPDGSTEAMRRFTETLLADNPALDDLKYLQLASPSASSGELRFDGGQVALSSRDLSPSETGLYAQELPVRFVPEPSLAAAMTAASSQAKPIAIAASSMRQARQYATTKTVWPLFAAANVAATSEAPADARLVGFLIASLKYDEVAWRAFQPLKGVEYVLIFDDYLGQHHPMGDLQHVRAEQDGINVEYPVKQGGGSIKILFKVAPSYFVENRSWQAWGLLAVGLLFTAMLCMVMLVLIGREARVEEIVADKTRQLRRERNQVSNLMATFPDPHFVTDDRGQIIELNEAAIRVLGKKRSELVGAQVQDCFEGSIMSLIKGQLDTLPRDRFEASRPVFLKAFDQRLIPASVHVSTFRAEDAPLFAITVRLAAD